MSRHKIFFSKILQVLGKYNFGWGDFHEWHNQAFVQTNLINVITNTRYYTPATLDKSHFIFTLQYAFTPIKYSWRC